MQMLIVEFKKLIPNIDLCNKLIRSNQKEYIRKRLRFIKFIFEGKTETEAYKEAGLCKATANKILHIMLLLGVEKGLLKLAEPKKTNRKFLLTDEQSEEIIEMIKTQSPTDYGYIKNVFTGEITAEIIKQKYGISVSKDFVYDLFHRKELSYHKAHRDYIDADKNKQKKYQDSLKKTGKH